MIMTDHNVVVKTIKEGDFAHAIGNHEYMDRDALEHRLLSEEKQTVSCFFKGISVAEVIRETLKKRGKKVEAWLGNDAYQTMTIIRPFEKSVGTKVSLPRGLRPSRYYDPEQIEFVVRSCYEVFLKLEKVVMPDGSKDIRVVTCYPQ